MRKVRVLKDVNRMYTAWQTTFSYHSFATTVSQLKICDFTGDAFKGFEVSLS